MKKIEIMINESYKNKKIKKELELEILSSLIM